MVDGPEFHEGEYVRFDVEKARGTNLYTFCWSKPYVLKIYAVSGDNLEFTQGNMIIAGYGNCLSSGASNAKYLFHKLTEKKSSLILTKQKCQQEYMNTLEVQPSPVPQRKPSQYQKISSSKFTSQHVLNGRNELKRNCLSYFMSIQSGSD
jgi:hypothetical protein